MTRQVQTFTFTGPTFQVFAAANAEFLGVAPVWDRPGLYVLTDLNEPMVTHQFAQIMVGNQVPDHLGVLTFLDKYVDEYSNVWLVFRVTKR